MKKSLKYFVLFWCTLFVLFNIIAFVSVGWIWLEKYTPAFWCGYGFIKLSFVMNLCCTLLVCKDKKLQKVFYDLAFLRVCYAGLITSFVIGGLAMLIPTIPAWSCILVFAITGAATVISGIKTRSAAQMVSETEDKIRENTQFMMLLRADAQSLVTAAANENNRQLAKKVYEALRFSDPVSNKELADMEQELTERFEAFVNAVKTTQNAEQASQAFLQLLEQRNQRIKILK